MFAAAAPATPLTDCSGSANSSRPPSITTSPAPRSGSPPPPIGPPEASNRSSALEDAAFATRLHDRNVRILRTRDVRVRTSARSHGRAARGLAVDLEVSRWLATRRFRAADFDPAALLASKGQQTVTVVIPTKECADTIAGVIGEVVAPLSEIGVVDELVVIDADSRDGTALAAARAGAQVIQQDEIAGELGPALGKGDAMWRALRATGGDVVCFLDGDTRDPSISHLVGLLGPILSDPEIKLVKGAFDRPLAAGRSGPPPRGRPRHRVDGSPAAQPA